MRSYLDVDLTGVYTINSLDHRRPRRKIGVTFAPIVENNVIPGETGILHGVTLSERRSINFMLQVLRLTADTTGSDTRCWCTRIPVHATRVRKGKHTDTHGQKEKEIKTKRQGLVFFGLFGTPGWNKARLG